MFTVPLNHQLVATFDDADAAVVRSLQPLRLLTMRTRSRTYHYVETRAAGRRRLVHRILTSAPPGVVVDHRDGDGLNNSRSNLRLCSHAENMRNRKPNAGKSLPKGVGQRPGGTFYAAIRAGSLRRFKGGFKTASEAAECYAAWAIELHQDFARKGD